MHHEQLKGLLDGERLTSIGGALVPLPPAPAAGVNAFGALQTILRFQPELGLPGAPQHMGRSTSRVLTASCYTLNGAGAGPIVGVATWGAGNGAQQSIEFDISTSIPTPAIINSSFGGAVLSVPATSLQIQARNDSNVLPRVGDAPLGNTTNTPSATAGFAIGHRNGTSQLTRTIYAVNALLGGPLANGANVVVGVPAFAQRFRMFRSSALNAIQVQMLATGGILSVVSGPYIDAASVPPSLYTLPANTQAIKITNNGPGTIDVLGVVFELGI
jgi:hypothetical protein